MTTQPAPSDNLLESFKGVPVSRPLHDPPLTLPPLSETTSNKLSHQFTGLYWAWTRAGLGQKRMLAFLVMAAHYGRWNAIHTNYTLTKLQINLSALRGLEKIWKIWYYNMATSTWNHVWKKQDRTAKVFCKHGDELISTWVSLDQITGMLRASQACGGAWSVSKE